MSAAEDRYVLTEAGEQALKRWKARRSAVLTWLASVARDGTFDDAGHAEEIRRGIEHGHSVGESSRNWLEQRTRRGDAIHRDWACWALAQFSEE